MKRTVDQYYKYLKNKNVILVGPAEYLRGAKQGRCIDNHDAVIRVNNAVPVLYPKDYGHRTNILYHAMTATVLRKEKHYNMIDVWGGSIDWFVSTIHYDMFKKRVQEYKAILDSNEAIKWLSTDKEYYNQIQEDIGDKLPSTGLVALKHLIDSPVESITVKGFDFYASGIYKGYAEPDDEVIPLVGSRWHDYQAQLRYLKTMDLSKVTMDDNLLCLIEGCD